jgi:predicted enzyme related to lactoylglutathione lyase
MHGICHFEVPSTDIVKSREFYTGLFGWECHSGDDPDYIMFSAPEGPGGGIEKAVPGRGAYVNVYIEVKDIPTTLAQAEKLGGKIVKEKTLISEELGYWAMFSDPSGVNIGLWSRE